MGAGQGKQPSTAKRQEVDVVLRRLGAGLDTNCTDEDGNTPLHNAAENGSMEMVGQLLAAGAAANAVNKDGDTPLHKAAVKGHEEVVGKLLAAGAAVNAANTVGDTPLYKAAAEGHEEVVGKLLAAGAAVNVANKGGYTPLHRAAGMGEAVAVGQLLRAGAAVDAVNVNGDTPLHRASHMEYLEVVKSLLAAGACTDITNKAGKTPANMSQESHHRTNQPAIMAALQAASKAQKAKLAPSTSPSSGPRDGSKSGVGPWTVAATRRRLPSHPAAACSTSTSAGGATTKLVAAPVPTATLGAMPPVEGKPAKLGAYAVGLVGLTAADGLVATALAVDSKLVEYGMAALFQVAGAVVTANPLVLLSAAIMLIKGLISASEAATYCKHKVKRVSLRVGALCPALSLLHDTLSSQATAEAVEERALQSLNDTLLCLFQVLLDLQKMMQLFASEGDGMVKRTARFLKARGYQQEFDDLDSSLRGCLGQLSCIVNISQLASKELASRQELRVQLWEEENVEALRTDMQQLEGLVLKAAGGVEELEKQMQAQGVGLQQVAEWLHAMQASSTAITAHLAEVHLKLDHVVQRVDNVDSTLQQILACLNRTAAEQQGPMPVVVIPRSDIHYTDADKQASPSGAFGTVVRATRDEGYVAVKIYTHRGLGDRDRKRVVQEALLLASANHPNIVRCYGIVHDPDNPNGTDNIQGSLVMEWVHGGDLYTWLQKYDNTSMYIRLKLAAQVAAGMKYLHEHRVVHGDLKPQNVLLLPSTAPGAIPEVKICDFGLAKHAATTQHATYSPGTRAYTLEYTSPERLKAFKRSYQDDIYAFGILMYFIASCDSPFHDIDTSRRRDAIQEGLRPDIDEWAEEEAAGAPKGMGEVVAAYCQLAKQCWHQDAAQRPTFADTVYPQLQALAKRCPRGKA